jgi:hypothetical protein
VTTSSLAPVARPGLVLPPWRRFAVAGVATALAGGGCVAVAGHAHPPAMVHEVALFAHLASVVVGLGSVVVVDWVALLWVVGRRELDDLVGMAATVAVPIWAGYAGLAFSGLLLEPHLGSPLTQVKLGLVLVIGLNGVFAAWQHAALQRNDSPRLLVLGTMSALLSQVCWWGATVVGFLSSH